MPLPTCSSDVNVPVYGTKLTIELARGRIDELGVEADLRTAAVKQWFDHGPFRFHLIPVSHSVPGATAVAIETPEGVIVHSGDFKLDPTPINAVPTDLPAFATLGRRGVRLLLADSTNAESPGFEPSESSVGQPIADAIRDAPGRVIAACFPLISIASNRSPTPGYATVANWRSSAARCIATRRLPLI